MKQKRMLESICDIEGCDCFKCTKHTVEYYSKGIYEGITPEHSELIAIASRWQNSGRGWFDQPRPYDGYAKTWDHEIERLIQTSVLNDPDGQALKELDEMFDGRISFGTAGLRAELGPGPKNMNALVVRQTTAAVLLWLQDQIRKEQGEDFQPEGNKRWGKIVIGYDARLTSQGFAQIAASVVDDFKFSPILADQACPTPVVAHQTLRQKALAGICITASHNPACDNGYKLYLGDGIQLVSPADEQISEKINYVLKHQCHLENYYTVFDQKVRLQIWEPRFKIREVSKWVEAHQKAVLRAFGKTEYFDVKCAYSAMHGVGTQPVCDLLEAAGFQRPLLVSEQTEPDGTFPTVDFPNPEEDGAMDLLKELVVKENCDIGLANDPDADRLAVVLAERAPLGDQAGTDQAGTDQAGTESAVATGVSESTGSAGGTRKIVALTGNELGVLLGDYVTRKFINKRKPKNSKTRIMARSIVSTSMLDRIAASRAAECRVTLTGFKWVARPMVDEPEANYLYGFEEAIGYCVGNTVRDKDGVSAALNAVAMVAELKAAGKTLWDRLDELYAELGVVENLGWSIRLKDGEDATEWAEKLKSAPLTEIDGETFVAEAIGAGKLPLTSGLQLTGNSGTRIIVRPSGTEPKIKAYLETSVEVDADLITKPAAYGERMADSDYLVVAEARQAAKAKMAALDSAVRDWVSSVA